MNDTPNPAASRSDWLDALAVSEAELAAALTVKSGPLRQRLRDSIAWLEEHLSSKG